MKPKLILLLMFTTFILGCSEFNPYLGKWHMIYEGENVIIEILKGGNILHYNSGGVESDQWIATERGIVVLDGAGGITGFLHEGSLFMTDEGETFIFERVK